MIIQLKQISKSYEIPGTGNRRTILDNITLTIDKGKMIGIVGPSGSGKSTLLNIIGTLDKPDEGLLSINGQDIKTLNQQKLAEIRNKHIGFVFQMHHLLPQLSLIENVLLPLIPQKLNKPDQKAASNRAKELLKMVSLADKITQKPGQMSVGECQRTALVRALINEPDILLADEPTGSLDNKSADQLSELLFKINSRHLVTMLVVTHSERLAAKLPLVYSLENGKLELRK